MLFRSPLRNKISDSEVSIEFQRRLGPDPHENGAQTIALMNCPDIFELENGCFAVIGIDIANRYNLKIGDLMQLEGDVFPGQWQFVVRAIRPTTTPEEGNNRRTGFLPGEEISPARR